MFFFFNDTATTEIYTLSLHDALPILARWRSSCSRTVDGRSLCALSDRSGTTAGGGSGGVLSRLEMMYLPRSTGDRKSTRLNSSHANISYAVFCLKKKIHLSSTHV